MLLSPPAPPRLVYKVCLWNQALFNRLIHSPTPNMSYTYPNFIITVIRSPNGEPEIWGTLDPQSCHTAETQYTVSHSHFTCQADRRTRPRTTSTWGVPAPTSITT